MPNKTCRFRQILVPRTICFQRLFFAYMKKINNAGKQKRPFLKVIKLDSAKHPSYNYKAANKIIIRLLKDIQDSVEIIARQIARWVRLDN